MHRRTESTAAKPNVCPACGPVSASASSQYCARHFHELLAAISEIPQRAA